MDVGPASIDQDVLHLFGRLGISLAIGMLVGIQRQTTDSQLAGIRTFSLVGLAGALSALLDQQVASGGWIIVAGILAIGAIVVVSKFRLNGEISADVGMTTAIAILIVYGIGVYAFEGSLVVAAAIGVTVAALLQLKPELHSIAGRLKDEEVRAILRFAVFSCIVLPVLPNEQMGPLNVFNPFNIWLMVVLIVGISLAGYITFKFFGQSTGVIVGGLLGGAISSTATSIAFARKSKESSAMDGLACAVVVIASSVVFLRVLIELAVVTPSHWREMGAPLAIMLAACVVASMIAWFLFRGQGEPIPEPTNPSEFKSALMFAGLYALVLWALAATKEYFHEDALYLVAAISGLTDMDAITLSTGRMVEMATATTDLKTTSGSSVVDIAGGVSHGLSPTTGWRLLLTASIANLVFKSGIIAIVGGRRLFVRVASLFVIPIVCGGLLLWFW